MVENQSLNRNTSKILKRYRVGARYDVMMRVDKRKTYDFVTFLKTSIISFRY